MTIRTATGVASLAFSAQQLDCEVAVAEEAAHECRRQEALPRELAASRQPSRGLVVPRWRRLDLHGAPECRHVVESLELRFFLEAGPLTWGKLRVDEDELWADRLGLQRDRRYQPRTTGQGCSERADCHLRNDQSPRSEDPNIPTGKGQRIELLREQIGVRLRGTVFYCDHLQILVKWDNGHSQSLRPGVDRFRIIE